MEIGRFSCLAVDPQDALHLPSPDRLRPGDRAVRTIRGVQDLIITDLTTIFWTRQDNACGQRGPQTRIVGAVFGQYRRAATNLGQNCAVAPSSYGCFDV